MELLGRFAVFTVRAVQGGILHAEGDLSGIQLFPGDQFGAFKVCNGAFRQFACVIDQGTVLANDLQRAGQVISCNVVNGVEHFGCFSRRIRFFVPARGHGNVAVAGRGGISFRHDQAVGDGEFVFGVPYFACIGRIDARIVVQQNTESVVCIPQISVEVEISAAHCPVFRFVIILHPGPVRFVIIGSGFDFGSRDIVVLNQFAFRIFHGIEDYGPFSLNHAGEQGESDTLVFAADIQRVQLFGLLRVIVLIPHIGNAPDRHFHRKAVDVGVPFRGNAVCPGDCPGAPDFMSLQRRFAVFTGRTVIGGVFHVDGNLSIFQLFPGHVPVEIHVSRFAGGNNAGQGLDRGAAIGGQFHGAGNVIACIVGNREVHLGDLARGEIAFFQHHGEFDRVIIGFDCIPIGPDRAEGNGERPLIRQHLGRNYKGKHQLVDGFLRRDGQDELQPVLYLISGIIPFDLERIVAVFLIDETVAPCGESIGHGIAAGGFIRIACVMELDMQLVVNPADIGEGYVVAQDAVHRVGVIQHLPGCIFIGCVFRNDIHAFGYFSVSFQKVTEVHHFLTEDDHVFNGHVDIAVIGQGGGVQRHFSGERGGVSVLVLGQRKEIVSAFPGISLAQVVRGAGGVIVIDEISFRIVHAEGEPALVILYQAGRHGDADAVLLTADVEGLHFIGDFRVVHLEHPVSHVLLRKRPGFCFRFRGRFLLRLDGTEGDGPGGDFNSPGVLNDIYGEIDVNGQKIQDIVRGSVPDDFFP